MRIGCSAFLLHDIKLSLLRTLNQIRYHEGLLGQRLGKMTPNTRLE